MKNNRIETVMTYAEWEKLHRRKRKKQVKRIINNILFQIVYGLPIMLLFFGLMWLFGGEIF